MSKLSNYQSSQLRRANESMSDYNARLAKLTKYQDQQQKQANDTRLTGYQDQQLKQADSAARLTDYQDQQLNGMSTGLEERKKGGKVKSKKSTHY